MKTIYCDLLSEYLPVVADSIETLRRCDVYRLLEMISRHHRSGVVDQIAKSRPDLIDEAEDCLRELNG